MLVPSSIAQSSLEQDQLLSPTLSKSHPMILATIHRESVPIKQPPNKLPIQLKLELFFFQTASSHWHIQSIMNVPSYYLGTILHLALKKQTFQSIPYDQMFILISTLFLHKKLLQGDSKFKTFFYNLVSLNTKTSTFFVDSKA